MKVQLLLAPSLVRNDKIGKHFEVGNNVIIRMEGVEKRLPCK